MTLPLKLWRMQNDHSYFQLHIHYAGIADGLRRTLGYVTDADVRAEIRGDIRYWARSAREAFEKCPVKWPLKTPTSEQEA